MKALHKGAGVESVEKGKKRMKDKTELSELILSAIDLLSMSKTFSQDDLEKIFTRIIDTSEGTYRYYAESVYRFILSHQDQADLSA